MGVALALGNTVKPPEPIGSGDEIENALQWLARMTRSFASDVTDDELHLFFDPQRRRFVTPEIAPATVLELSLPDLVLQFEENGLPSPHAMDVDDKSTSEIEAWLLCEMLHRGFDRDRFSKRLPYKSDHLLTGDERKYAPSAHLDELRGHAESLVAASRIIRALRAASTDGPADIPSDRLMCWPESSTIGFISTSRDGAADLKVGYALASARGGTPAGFFVAFRSPPFRDKESKKALDVSEDRLGAADPSIVETLSSMMVSMRVSVAN